MDQNELIAMLWKGCWLILASTAVYWHFAMEPLRWKFVYIHSFLVQPSSEEVESKAVMIRNALYATAFFSYIMPFKLGIPIKFFLLKKTTEFDVGKIISIFGWDFILSLFCWSFSGILIIYFFGFYENLKIKFTAPYWSFALILLAVFLSLFYFKKIKQIIITSKNDCFINLGGISMIGALLAIDIFSYFMRHVFLAMAVSIDNSSIFLVGVAGVVATFVGMISGLPMGLVGYDAAFAVILISFGISGADAAKIILLNRFFNFFIAIILGIPASRKLNLGERLADVLKMIKARRKNE